MRKTLSEITKEELRHFSEPDIPVYKTTTLDRISTKSVSSTTSVKFHFWGMETIILGTEHTGEM